MKPPFPGGTTCFNLVRVSTVLAFFLWGIGPGVVRADIPASGPIVPELAPLQQAMTNYMTTHQFNAGTIGLMHDSRLVLREGYGWRNTNLSAVIHPDYLFRLSSVSKMLTASAIQKLVAGGHITTNTLIYNYLGIPPWGGTLGDSRITNITVQMLLDHTGGWDNTISPVGDAVFSTIQISSDMGLDYPAAPTNIISWMFSKPLDFTPGTRSAYANFGYQILGRVIEKASGKSYMNYIQQDLLGNAVITNSLGFLNVILSRSRPRDLAPWETWYGDFPTLTQSAVDYPTNLQVRYADGGYYYESFDSFGGVSASAIGLCRYLLNYWEGGGQRVPATSFGWGYIFFGSLPGSTTVLYQNINQTPTATNGLEFAALFNQRNSASTQDNQDAETAIYNASTTITSWPTNGGGMIQWGLASTNVYTTAGSVTINLVRSGLSTLPVKVSYSTYGVTAGSADYVSSSGVVSFAAGQTNQPITVTLLNNPANTNSTEVTLELISASGGAWLGNQLSSAINIFSPPRFAGPATARAGGGLTASISASNNQVMSVLVSTNFSTWQTLQTVTNTNGIISIIDTNAPHRKGSFYKLSVP